MNRFYWNFQVHLCHCGDIDTIQCPIKFMIINGHYPCAKNNTVDGILLVLDDILVSRYPNVSLPTPTMVIPIPWTQMLPLTSMIMRYENIAYQSLLLHYKSCLLGYPTGLRPRYRPASPRTATQHWHGNPHQIMTRQTWNFHP